MGMFLHLILKRLAIGGAAEAEDAVNGVFSSGREFVIPQRLIKVSSVVNLKESCRLLKK